MSITIKLNHETLDSCQGFINLMRDSIIQSAILEGNLPEILACFFHIKPFADAIYFINNSTHIEMQETASSTVKLLHKRALLAEAHLAVSSFCDDYPMKNKVLNCFIKAADDLLKQHDVILKAIVGDPNQCDVALTNCQQTIEILMQEMTESLSELFAPDNRHAILADYRPEDLERAFDEIQKTCQNVADNIQEEDLLLLFEKTENESGVKYVPYWGFEFHFDGIDYTSSQPKQILSAPYKIGSLDSLIHYRYFKIERIPTEDEIKKAKSALNT